MLFINTIDKEQVLNSYNFARQADVVYSEIISRKNFEHINKENLQILFEDKDKIFYFKKNFEIANNQIIFTNNYLLQSLFELLNKNSNLKNLKLITHQTDFSITKKIFNTRPNSISKWYSINVYLLSDGWISFRKKDHEYPIDTILISNTMIDDWVENSDYIVQEMKDTAEMIWEDQQRVWEPMDKIPYFWDAF